MNVFELFAKLGLDTSEYDKGLENSEKKGSDFGKNLGAVVGTGAKVAGAAIAATTAATVASAKAFVSGVADVSSYGDAIDKNSQKMNMSAKGYQEWDFILKHTGTSIESMKTSMKKLTTSAEEGNDAFSKLGITQEDLKNMSPEETWNKTINALQKVEDAGERTALATKLLGKGAVELGPLFNTSAEETENMRKQVHDLGGVMSDEAVKASANYQDSLQNMNTALSGMKNNMLSSFLPAFTTTMDGLSAIFSGKDINGGLKKIEDGIKGLADGLVTKAPQVFQIGGSILKALLSSITTNLPILLDAAVPIILELASGLIQNAPSILSAVLSVIGTIASALGDPANLSGLLKSAVDIILVLSDAISTNAPTVIPAIVDIIMTMLNALTDESVLMPLLQAGLSVITSIVQGILKALPVLIKNLPTLITNIVNFIVNSTPLIIQAAIQLFMGIVKAIPDIIVELGKQLPTIISAIVKGLLAGTAQIVTVGSDLIKGLWKGISDMGKWIGEKIKGFGKGILDSLKTFFGIHSPSTVFRDMIGKNLALGIGEGFSDEINEVAKDMAESAGEITDDINNALAFDGLAVSGVADMNGYSMMANGTQQVSASGSTASMDSIMAYIDNRLSKMEFVVPVYIGGKKIDQQIVTANARIAVVSGGR